MAGVVEAFAERAPDPDGGRVYRLGELLVLAGDRLLQPGNGGAEPGLVLVVRAALPDAPRPLGPRLAMQPVTSQPGTASEAAGYSPAHPGLWQGGGGVGGRGPGGPRP